MEIASLSSPLASPPPAAADRGNGKPSFAERLEAAATRASRHAARTDAKNDNGKDTAPPIADNPATPADSADEAAKGDNPGSGMAAEADELATEKAATEAAADPGALIAQMLQTLTAPAQAPAAKPAAGTEAAAKPDPRQAIEAAAKQPAGTNAAKPADETEPAPSAVKAEQPAPAPAEAAASKPAPAPADAGSLGLAAGGTGAPSAPAAAVPHGHEAAARAAPVPLTPQALSLSIAKHAAAGERVFEISLTPDDLGRVDVRLEFSDDGRLTAHVYADRPETLSLLERDRGELARALAGQGLAGDGSSLNFALRDDRAGGNANSESNGRRGRNRGPATADTALAGDVAQAAARRRDGRASGALDLEV